MSAGIDAAFNRMAMTAVTADVKKYIPGVKLRDAWVWKCGKDHWEFHYGNYYWQGSAYDASDARAKGWSEYLGKLGVEGYALVVPELGPTPPPFDPKVVEKHIAADARMGRSWHSPHGCGCAHCRMARGAK